MPNFRLVSLCAVWLCLTVAPVSAQTIAPAAASSVGDWQAGVRQRVAAQDLPGALSLAETRLAESPGDLEARGWRARILGWLGRWPEAERDYRRVLERAPKDVDILVGLGRALRAQDRPAEARESFRAALAIDPKNAEAEQALASVRQAPRHQLSVNVDADHFNYTPQGAQAYAAAIRSDWTSRWMSVLGARFDHRSGLSAGRWSGALTAKLPARSALTVGGSFGRDNGIVSHGEIFADAGHGFTFDRSGFIRGIEANLQTRRLWFDAADVLTVAPSAILYLPRDWMVSLAVTAARSSFPDVGAEWRPSSVTRVTFPVTAIVTGHVFFAAGTENFALVDQIGRFSARTFGGGARVRLPGGRDVTGYLAYQARTQGRSQTSVGFGYVVRF